MPTYRATVAYDGTDFEGWQRQRRGARTVQAALEEALATLAAGQLVRVAGAGRTDTGVHAVGQVASFDLPRDLSPSSLVRALNAILPRDVRVLDAAVAPDHFHARRSATSKLYRYAIDVDEVQLPTRRRIAAHVAEPLDLERVQAAARVYVGRRDFASVASSGSSVRTTVRDVRRSEAWLDGGTLVYEVEADGFLRRMVRSLVGGLIACGHGRLDAAALERSLERRDRQTWPAPAPACGLTLVLVRYAASTGSQPESAV